MTGSTDLDVCPFCGKGRLAPEYERNGKPEYYTCTNCMVSIPYASQQARIRRRIEQNSQKK
jgi:hypothetical protein